MGEGERERERERVRSYIISEPSEPTYSCNGKIFLYTTMCVTNLHMCNNYIFSTRSPCLRSHCIQLVYLCSPLPTSPSDHQPCRSNTHNNVYIPFLVFCSSWQSGQ